MGNYYLARRIEKRNKILANIDRAEIKETKHRLEVVRELCGSLVDREAKKTEFNNASDVFQALENVGKLAARFVASNDATSISELITSIEKFGGRLEDIKLTQGAIKAFINELFRGDKNFKKCIDLYYAYNIDDIIPPKSIIFNKDARKLAKKYIYESVLKSLQKKPFVVNSNVTKNVEALVKFFQFNNYEIKKIFRNIKRIYSKSASKKSIDFQTMSEYHKLEKYLLTRRKDRENQKSYLKKDYDQSDRSCSYAQLREERRSKIGTSFKEMQKKFSEDEIKINLKEMNLIDDTTSRKDVMKVFRNLICVWHDTHFESCNSSINLFQVVKEDIDSYKIPIEILKKKDLFEEEIPFYEGKTQSLLEICDLIKNLKDKNIVITCHINPDCDAYGSSIALGIMLKAFGANVVYVNQSAHDASSFDSLSQLGYYETSKKLRNHQISKVEILSTIPDDRQFDMAFMLDGKLDRAGSVTNVLKERSIPIVKIDHHVDEGGAFRDVDSTCEIVSGIYKILSQEHKFTFTQNDAISRCLYTGWASDTKGFSFASENKRAHILRGFISDNTKIQTNVSDEKGKNDTYYRNLKDKVTDNFESRLFRHAILSLYDELYNEIQIRYVPYKIRKLYPKIPIRITSDFYRASGCVSFFEQEDGSLTFNLCLKKDRYGGDRFNFKAIDLIKAIDQNGGGHVNAGGGILSEQIFEQERLNKIIQLIPKQARDITTNAYIYKTLYNINKIKQENISNDEKFKNISEIVFFLPDEILDQVLELNSSLGEFDFINDNSELLVRFLRDCILNRFNSIAW